MIEISVIIPTRNRADYLNKALESIVKQTISDSLFEVIVVDNGSSDNTKEVVESYSDKIKNIRYVLEEKPGLHNGRHCGLFNSKGEILIYADDDIIAFPNWIQAVYNRFKQNDEAVLIGGKNIPKFEVIPPKWLLKMWNRKKESMNVIGPLSIIDQGEDVKYCDPSLVYGCNFSIRKDVLLEIGGFHPDVMPKDLVLFMGDGETFVTSEIKRKGYKAIYDPEASVHHYVIADRMKLSYFYQRGFQEGISQSFKKIRNNPELKYRNQLSVRYNWTKNKLILLIKSLIKIVSPLHIFYLASFNFENGLIDGKKIYYKELRKNDKLLAWVLRENYYE